MSPRLTTDEADLSVNFHNTILFLKFAQLHKSIFLCADYIECYIKRIQSVTILVHFMYKFVCLMFLSSHKKYVYNKPFSKKSSRFISVYMTSIFKCTFSCLCLNVKTTIKFVPCFSVKSMFAINSIN